MHGVDMLSGKKKSIFDVNLEKNQHVAESFWPDSKVGA
jgi:hypothetical protein